MTCLLKRTVWRFFALTIRFAKTNRDIASVISARSGTTRRERQARSHLPSGRTSAGRHQPHPGSRSSRGAPTRSLDTLLPERAARARRQLLASRAWRSLLGDDAEALPGVLLVLRLQLPGELVVGLVGDDGQPVDLRVVDPLAVLIHREAEPAPDLLALAICRRATRSACRSERRSGCPSLRAVPSG